MLPAQTIGKNIKDIIRLIPYDQIRHMSNVGILVDVMANKIMQNVPRTAASYPYRHFGHAAFYHDIGKAYISQELLSKQGKLTAEETQAVQQHTLLAQELFYQIRERKILGFPEYLISLSHDAAVYHHEWWNGQGYPFGLSHDQIPFISRVTAICDAYDAMTSTRTYRRAYSHEFACEELEKKSGIQFDPELVKAFLANEAEFLSLAARRVTAV
ncbi:MAG TPA: HD domain-containing phosphohydrolase [Clostridia bacterium]|nr:HD domain-containing phosphohydrolase [Clostridia bacterium]